MVSCSSHPKKERNSRHLACGGCLGFHVVACDNTFFCWHIPKMCAICSTFSRCWFTHIPYWMKNKSTGDHMPFSGNERKYKYIYILYIIMCIYIYTVLIFEHKHQRVLWWPIGIWRGTSQPLAWGNDAIGRVKSLALEWGWFNHQKWRFKHKKRLMLPYLNINNGDFCKHEQIGDSTIKNWGLPSKMKILTSRLRI